MALKNSENRTPMEKVLYEVKKVIVGQDHLLERMIVALLARGHILVEGVPGLAKTMAIKTLAESIGGEFKRIQFTPDLVPADLVGTRIYNQKTGKFETSLGPVFTNLLLADEINRAPAKVQSALLEAMQERQVTIGNETFHLEEPFLVLATQNPIEQEGTYPLPEAQVDRFLLKVKIGYPTKEEERDIVRRNLTGETPNVHKVVSPNALLRAREVMHGIYMDEKIEQYILNLVFATRFPSEYGLKSLAPLINYGASPRASISMAQASRALAFLRRRGYVVPEDVRAIAADVLRHRLGLTYEAEAENVTPEDIIGKVLNTVEVP
jgi:MoxR-like ATPase